MSSHSYPASGQVFKLVCQKIKQETHDVKSFIFSTPKPIQSKKFQYKAGQHISFTVNIGGREHRCNYTLSSSPTDISGIRITIKRVPNGKVSNYFHDHFSVGQEIETNGAVGDFHLPSRVPEKVLMISAGSGVTPMLSMLRFMVKNQCKNHIIFFHSAKSEADIIAQKEVESLVAQHGNCEVVYTLTQKVKPRWLGFNGRVSPSMLAGIQQLSHYQVFVCGPKLFRKSVQEILRTQGLPRDHYHYESFGIHEYSKKVEQVIQTEPPSVLEPESSPNIKKSANVSIYFKQWNKYYQGNQKDTILEQGEAAGLILPFSCRAGCCGNCKAKLLNGKVQELSKEGLSLKERQQGYVLLCSCTALTDIEVSHE